MGTNTNTSLQAVHLPNLIIALQNVFHLAVRVGGVLHGHCFAGITSNEACMQEEKGMVLGHSQVKTSVVQLALRRAL